MGKFSNSKIHDMYSDWHWNLVQKDEKYRRLYVSDIDRLWIEYDFKRKSIVAVMDIKWENSNDGLTATEKGIYEWFEKNGAHCYIIYISDYFDKFRVVDFEDGEEITYNSTQYADWLLSLRNGSYINFDHPPIPQPSMF